MPSNTEIATVWGGVGNKSATAIIAELEGRGIYVVKDAENPTALNPGNATYLIFNGVLFWFDATDTLTAHDGVNCIVTADGKRFKALSYQGIQAKLYPVKSKSVAVPPVSPAFGDAYVVAAGGTGVWAAKDKQIATFTTRSWKFINPNAYDMVRVNDEVLIYHYSAAGVWTAGFPALTLGTGVVSPSAIKYGRFGFAVINQTTNAPPGSSADGDCYIVGPAPTGTWTGFSGYVMNYETSAFVPYLPYEGAQVYDRNTQNILKFVGGVWLALATIDPNAPRVIAAANYSTIFSTGTYVRAGTLVTITDAAHGMATGHSVDLLFSSGAASSGFYKITVTGVNTYTITDSISGVTSGNVTRRVWVRKMFGIQRISYSSVGNVVVYMLANAPDIYYLVFGSCIVTSEVPSYLSSAYLVPGLKALGNFTLVSHNPGGSSGGTAYESSTVSFEAAY